MRFVLIYEHCDNINPSHLILTALVDAGFINVFMCGCVIVIFIFCG